MATTKARQPDVICKADKIQAMQNLISEALRSGISPLTMQDILADARRKAAAGA
jgi:hypothetical protein